MFSNHDPRLQSRKHASSPNQGFPNALDVGIHCGVKTQTPIPQSL